MDRLVLNTRVRPRRTGLVWCVVAVLWAALRFVVFEGRSQPVLLAGLTLGTAALALTGYEWFRARPSAT